MPRRSAATRAAAQARQIDHGPDLVLARGERFVIEAPDPDRPNVTVRRAMAYWLPAVLHHAGQLSDAALAAAIRLRNDAELALGAREGDPLLRVDGSRRFGPTQIALDAQARVRRALAAVGRSSAACLQLAVIGNATLADLARALGCSDGATADFLRSVLDRLARHYDCS